MHDRIHVIRGKRGKTHRLAVDPKGPSAVRIRFRTTILMLESEDMAKLVPQYALSVEVWCTRPGGESRSGIVDVGNVNHEMSCLATRAVRPERAGARRRPRANRESYVRIRVATIRIVRGYVSKIDVTDRFPLLS